MKWIVLVVAAIVLGTAFAWAHETQMDGAALWKRISVTSPYTTWGQFPDHKGMHPGQAPHGPLHVVYVNEVGMKKGWPKPCGTLIVKENYTKDQSLAAITVMYKMEGYNPEAGDWYWVKYAPDGTVQKEGAPKGCVNCHAVRKSHDYIRVSNY